MILCIRASLTKGRVLRLEFLFKFIRISQEEWVEVNWRPLSRNSMNLWSYLGTLQELYHINFT